MPYCTQADIQNLFGTTNVKVWSNLDNDQTDADTDRIAAAIVYAGAQIDKRFRGSIYTIPLATSTETTPEDIIDIAARLAGVWLYESRSMDSIDEADDGKQSAGILNHRRHAHAQIDRYLAGQDQLDAVLVSSGVVAPFAVD